MKNVEIKFSVQKQKKKELSKNFREKSYNLKITLLNSKAYRPRF